MKAALNLASMDLKLENERLKHRIDVLECQARIMTSAWELFTDVLAKRDQRERDLMEELDFAQSRAARLAVDLRSAREVVGLSALPDRDPHAHTVELWAIQPDSDEDWALPTLDEVDVMELPLMSTTNARVVLV